MAPEEQQDDGEFIVFTDPKWGIRAIARTLKTYQREGIATLDEAIRKWSQTDQAAYVANVCAACQVKPDQVTDFNAIMLPMIRAIIQQENGLNNGQPWYPDSLISYAIGMA